MAAPEQPGAHEATHVRVAEHPNAAPPQVPQFGRHEAADAQKNWPTGHVHVPATHVAPPLQVVQLEPPVPQAVLLFPG